MTLLGLINSIDSDTIQLTINGDVSPHEQICGLIVKKHRLGDFYKQVSEKLVSARVSSYEIEISVGSVPFVTVCLDGVEPYPEEEPMVPLRDLLSLFSDKNTRICVMLSGSGRIYTGPISGLISNISVIYNKDILYRMVEKVYVETDIDNEGKKTTFFIRIGGQS